MQSTTQERSLEQSTDEAAVPFVAQFLVIWDGFDSALKVSTQTKNNKNKDTDTDW